MTCPECNEPVAEGRDYCGTCGAPLTNPPPAIGNGPPQQEDLIGNTLIDEPEHQPELPAGISLNDRMKVATGCDHVIGKVKENNQDYCAISRVDYPLHGYCVILQTGADGIGGGTGGERWAATTVHLFLAAMGVRLPAFDQEDKFVDRDQFWQLLNEKVKTYFFPSINWVTGCVYSFGVQEVGIDKHQRPAKVFGATWTASVLICDLKKGRGIMHGYCVGDPALFLITEDKVEKLNTDDAWAEGPHKGSLTRWVGQSPQANGQVILREFQLDQETPYVHILHCSDGLTNMLSPDAIAGIARGEAEPEHAVSQLLDQAVNVQLPYGQVLEPEKDPPITPGDDNVFAAITTIRSTFVEGAYDHEETESQSFLPDTLSADEDESRARTDGENLHQHQDAGKQ
ncbi:MAG: hypothetical protein WDN47_04095 [Candidatus Doudnabacteria bacterium]